MTCGERMTNSDTFIVVQNLTWKEGFRMEVEASGSKKTFVYRLIMINWEKTTRASWQFHFGSKKGEGWKECPIVVGVGGAVLQT